MVELYLLSGALVLLGVYNWKLTNDLQEAYDQIDLANELILGMAHELQEYGSPNVKVTPIEK